MGSFHLHRSNRVERLVAGLGDLLERPVGGPFETELVAVPGRGMSIWLSRELAKRFGVWATPLVYPRELVERVVKMALGEGALGTEPLTEDLLEWAVRAELPSLLSQPEFAEIQRYLAGDERGTRVGRLSAKLATVFDQYLTYRPDWIRVWEQGGTAGVPEDQRFQALLFRRVAARLGRRHVAHVEERLLGRLNRSEPAPGLPRRVALFGLSTLPPLFVRVLVGLSRHADVHCFLFSASPRAFESGAGEPLLESLGKQGRDFFGVLRETLEEQGLPLVEHDLHAEPSRLTPPVIAAHACHGPMREVEVLHDQLLALLTRADDPVAPEDVVVLMPDVETYAPLVEAVFARDRADPRFIPFQVSDRAPRDDAPMVDALLRVLGMVRSRLTAADVVDLLSLGPVASRLALDAVAVDKIKEWVSESGIRWGMDAEQRAELGLPARDDNTWRFGLRRLLLGYAMPGHGEHTFGDLLPYDEVEGKDAALLGSLAAFVRTLFELLRGLERPRMLSDWAVAIREIAERLFGDDASSVRQLGRIRRTLDGLAHSAATARFDGELDVDDLRDLLLRKLDAQNSERGFLGQGVTFCRMVPMRSIPFRVVCLLGLNDSAFPRSPRPIEFDLVHDGRLTARPGDRSTRTDDRYLFLETLAAAREALVITYSGRSVRDDRPRPPSVCLNELVEHLAESSATARDVVRKRLVTHHRLQGYSPCYFDGSDPRLASYALEYAGAARAVVEKSRASGAFVEALPELPKPDTLLLDELTRFFKSPPAYLLSRRLGIYLNSRRAELRDREPLELDALDAWKIGNPLVNHRLEGRTREQSERLFRGAGVLPLGVWGNAVLGEYETTSLAIAQRTGALRGGAELLPELIDVKLEMGVRLVGSVDGCFARGIVVHTYSKLSARRRLELWIRHLAGCAMGKCCSSFLVARSKKKDAEATEFPPLPRAEATRLLGELASLYFEGQTRPLRFLPEPSYVHAAQLHKQKSPLEALDRAASEYVEDPEQPGYDPYAERAFDHSVPPFDASFDRGERALEQTEFHRVALAVYRPLLDCGREAADA